MNKPENFKYEQKYGLGTEPLSTEDSISPEYFEKEREKLFKRSWICIGRQDDIAKVGDYFVKDIEVLQTSILITRDKDNQIKGFHNICPHRLNKLVDPGGGSTRKFMCKFHGWTFDLDGKLSHCSNQELFADFDKDDFGLPMVHTDIWEGFIFINVAEQPKETLKEWMGDLDDQFKGYWDDMELRGKWHAEVNCNWKLYIDANTEAYHAPTLHASSLRNSFASPDNPNCAFNTVRLFGRHRIGSVYANPDYIPSPVEGLTFQIAETPLYPATSATTANLPPAVNPDRDPRWAFDVDIIFPNLQFGAANGWSLVFFYWPLSVNKTLFETRLYMYKPKTAGDVISQEYTAVHVRDVLREDMSTLEGTQQMMESGVVKTMKLCDEEITVRHNHETVANFIAEAD
jgi:phenylpropionate dioxygenase-like ring-hydroxylating dioxygenase large terminal subunit